MRATTKTAVGSDSGFGKKVDSALLHAQKILHDAKHCSVAGTVAHSFQDKFGLVEVVTRLSVAAQFNTLMIMLGVSPSAILNMREKAQISKRSVSLRFESQENCEFKFHDQVERKSEAYSVSTLVGNKKEYTITKIDQYHWEFTYSYRLFAFLGSDPKDELVCLTNGTGTYKFITPSKEPAPRPVSHLCNFPDLNITWLLEHSAQEEGVGDVEKEGEEKIIEEAQMGVFSISRFAASCRTPTRNDEIEEAWDFAIHCSEFWEEIRKYFQDNLFAFYVQKTHQPGCGAALHHANIFVPVLPIFRDALSPEVASSSLRLSGLSLSSSSLPDIDEHQTSALVHQEDRSLKPVQQTLLLQLQCRNLAEKVTQLKMALPEVHANVASQTDVRLAVAAAHMTHICDTFQGCVNYMESLLRKQLIITIGRELMPSDFDNYMLFHNHRIFREEYTPKIFSYQVRTGGRPSEGTFSLLPLTPSTGAHLGSFTHADPYKTFVSHDIPREPFVFAINSSTNVAVQGERYLHSMVLNSFSGSPSIDMRLNARSRPFCNFIVIAGRMTANNVLDPEIAAVVQRKDELDILLQTEPIPAPKAFRDAIASLSPEMQRFAKAYRSMQLSSTLFGVCILEIKPQVERALNLPEGSLYKETELMDDVIDLFLEFNIPADLMSYDGFVSDHPAVKVARVKELIAEIQNMIKKEKEALLPPPSPPPSQQSFMLFGGRPGGGPPPRRGMGGPPPRGGMGGPPPRGGMGRGGPPMMRGGARGGGGRGRGGPPPPCPGGGGPPPPPPACAPPPAPGGAPPPPPAACAPPPAVSGPPPPPPAVGGPPPPPGAPSAPSDSKPQEKKETTPSLESGGFDDEGSDRDVTKVPMELDGKFDKLDPDGAVRPTIINFEGQWFMKSFDSILSPPTYAACDSKDQDKKKKKAFDLLDSITRSGAIPYVGGQLHVVTVLTHCFDDSLINTLWLESVNPIERVEATGLIAASVVHQTSPVDMVVDSAHERIQKYSRGVFDALEVEYSKKKE